MKISTIVAALSLSITACLAMPAQAAIEDQQDQGSAAANCQGALPNFEGQLRKRPLGVINEGTTNAFVTCAFNTVRNQGDTVLGNTIVNYFGGFFINNTAADATVTCTGVVGLETGEPGTETFFVQKSVVVKANRVDPDAQFGYIFFDPSDSNLGEGMYYQLVQMSCNLPAGVGINDTYVGYRIDDNT